ncbi:MAG: TonB-dependent receptor plug domain-containing protein [Opitutaceae bacterium]|nr:TonB-dependent receptor plug domain-containing protein [Opitutaceae bacterium]
MTRKSITAGAYVAAAVLSLAVAPRSLGQAAPAAAPAAGTPAADEEVVLLSPFVVSAAEDKGYRATSTLAGTRITTDLKDVGSAISVITEQFMSDTGSHNAENLLVYATNTEVAGQGGSFAGTGDGAQAGMEISSSPVANTRVRGLVSADNTRDFFLTDIPWDSYNVGRVDLQRGPNAILFGIGSPAGLVNSSTNQAALNNANKVEAGLVSYGTNRLSADFNRVLLDDELAVRVSLLRDDTKYKQTPAYRLDKRGYAAFRWDPKFLKTDSARTSLRANFEKGKVGGSAPRLPPPMDAITPWFANLNKAGYDMSTVNSTDPKVLAADPLNLAGSANTGNANYNAWLGSTGNRVYDGVIMQWTPRPWPGWCVCFFASPVA